MGVEAFVDDSADGVPRAKLDALVEQMREVVDGGHRAPVFSQFTGFLSLVRERLDAGALAGAEAADPFADRGQRGRPAR